MGGVELWRGGLGGAYRLPTLASVGASLAQPCFRFHTPLIEFPHVVSFDVQGFGKWVLGCTVWALRAPAGVSSPSRLKWCLGKKRPRSHPG